MRKSPRIPTILFGHIGDTLMALALFDDILSIDPTASFLILTRRNVALTRELAAAYPNIEVREIPNGRNDGYFWRLDSAVPLNIR